MSDVTRYDRRRRGECIKCEAKIEGPLRKAFCDKCKEEHRREVAARRAKSKEEGRCRCGRPLSPPLATCDECYFKQEEIAWPDLVGLMHGENGLKRRWFEKWWEANKERWGRMVDAALRREKEKG